jgi:nucleoid DNA-binding protein
VERKARLGRNPRKPDEIFPIPARRVIRFKMARKLTDQLSPQ